MGVLRPLRSLSFSRYRRLRKCQLSGALLFNQSRGTLPRPSTGRLQVLGEIFHAVMRTVNKAMGVKPLSPADVRTTFNNVVDDAHARIQAAACSRHLGDPRRWSELTDVYRSVTDLSQMPGRDDSTAKVEVHAEEEIHCKDLLLVGTPDAYFIRSDGIELVDYKSGLVSEGDDSNLEHIEQLYFYAYLIREKYGSYPSALRLIGLNGEVVEVVPAPERSDALASDMKMTLAGYNTLAAQGASPEKAASPRPDSCIFCEAKPICKAFWLALSSMEFPSWNHVALGTLIKPIERSRLGGGSIQLSVEQSSLRTNSLKVARVFEQRYHGVNFDQVGQRLLLTGLRQAHEGEMSLVEATERSLIIAAEPIG